MKSIVQAEKRCFFCGSQIWIEEHHIFGGALRKKSEKFGLKVYLCHYCHNEPPDGVHFNSENMNMLKSIGQRVAMDKYGWTKTKFMQEFYANYLEDDKQC